MVFGILCAFASGILDPVLAGEMDWNVHGIVTLVDLVESGVVRLIGWIVRGFLSA